jgi:hypothetical protein
VYRRSFTKLSMLSGAAALILPACDASRPGSTSVLSAEERELFDRFAEAYMPTEGTALKPLSAVPVTDNIDRILGTLDEATLDEVHLGLKLFNYGSVVIGWHFARFVHLEIPERLDYLRRWLDGAEMQRAIASLIRKLVCVGYWQDIEAARAIGYHGPVSVEAKLASLGNAPMPEASAEGLR